jgi:DNA-binding CsgD family transcriptional regulator
VRCELVGIWRNLIANDALTLCIVEDPALPHPRCIECFAASVFVAADFVQGFLANPTPHLSALVYEAILANRSPVLSLPEIARANSGFGLCALTLHFDFRERDFSSPRVPRILAAAEESARFFRAGYRINTVIGVVFGRDLANCLGSAGWPILQLPETALSRSSANAADDLQAHLVLHRKEQVPSSTLHSHALFFHASDPLMGFSRAEQRVLERALLEHSDAAIARDLGISLDAVKQTWRRAFDRVGRVLPYVIPAGNAASDTRGSEKRRHLLHYLRSHLEELRPHVSNSPKRGLSRRSRHC